MIETIPGTSPIALSMYCMPPVELAEMEVQIIELLRLGFICRSKFPLAAPALFAKKKDGTLTLCIGNDEEKVSTA